MSKKYDNIMLILLLVLFYFLFRSNELMRLSVLSSCELWFTTLVPSMTCMFILVDLALNYGLIATFYSIFKNNRVLLVLLCLLLGTPTSTKYVKEFYVNGYISKSEAERILASFYSPNPLFILAISPSSSQALKLFLFLYITDLTIYLCFKKCKDAKKLMVRQKKVSFSKCLMESTEKSFKTLILVLGTIIFFGLINTILKTFIPDNYAPIYIITEMTNAIKILKSTGNFEWLFLAIGFSGLSIHAQIKSILDDTDIKYKYFLFGRILASAIALLIILLY